MQAKHRTLTQNRSETIAFVAMDIPIPLTPTTPYIFQSMKSHV